MELCRAGYSPWGHKEDVTFKARNKVLGDWQLGEMFMVVKKQHRVLDNQRRWDEAGSFRASSSDQRSVTRKSFANTCKLRALQQKMTLRVVVFAGVLGTVGCDMPGLYSLDASMPHSPL